MKQGALLNRILMLFFLGVILVYIGVYTWDALTNPFTLVNCYSATVEDVLEATGVIVREEQVLQGSAAVVEPLFQEGEKVSKGDAVVRLYNSSDAAARSAQLSALEEERTQLQYALAATSTTSSNARLNDEIIDAIAALRAATAAGDFTRLEDQTMELRGLIYQRSAAYGEGGADQSELQTRLESINSQIASLTAQTGLESSSVTVDQPGIFSGEVDGYESLLTPEEVLAMAPAQLEEAMSQSPGSTADAVGKLITDSTWYFACALPEEQADRLTEGRSIEVRFSRDWSGEVDMTVERISAPVEGECAVVLSSSKFLSETTLLRRQTVELVLRSQEGLRVPAGAVRTEARTDEETGETDWEVGVYALVGLQAEFKPVEILDQRDDYCVVSPVDSDNASDILRSGDQVIIAGAEIYDGMVID